MSVPKGQRNHSVLEVQVKGDELVVHTVRIMANERTFDPKYQRLADIVLQVALDALMCIDEANDVRVDGDPDRWRERRRLQERGIRKLMGLCTLMRVCRRTYHMRGRKYAYWSGLAKDTLALARRWRDSDAKRYGHL